MWVETGVAECKVGDLSTYLKQGKKNNSPHGSEYENERIEFREGLMKLDREGEDL